MSVGLYSGVSGLALGIGLYRNVSGLWGGASGLIDGFGGADPYAGASLYLNFLNPELDSRITFSRGTNATLIDSTGKLTYAPNNLFQRSEEFENVYWARAAVNVTADATSAPNGTLTADKVFATATSGIHGAYTSLTLAATTYIYSCYAKAAEYSLVRLSEGGSGRFHASFNLSNGTVIAGTTGGTQFVSASIIPVGDGWYRCAIVFTGTVTGYAPAFAGYPAGATLNIYGVDYVGDGVSGTFFWGAQLEQVTYQTTPGVYNATTASAYYGPRFDYDPVTLAPRGLLIEEARTNLVLRSEEINDATWVKNLATVAANATSSPDGTAAAEKLVVNNSITLGPSTGAGVRQNVTKAASSLTYTFSAFVKAAEFNSVILYVLNSGATGGARCQFNLAAGTASTPVLVGAGFSAVSATIANAASGWYRCTITVTTDVDTILQNSILPADTVATTGNGTSGIYVWGAQLEAGSFATSYIPTVASTVTRNADVATMTGTNFSTWYNQTQGTFVTDFSRFGFDAVPGSVILTQADDGTTNNRVALRLNSRVADASAQATIVSGGSVLVNAGAGTLASMANRIVRATLAYQVGTPAVGRDGSVGDVAAIASLPTVNQLSIGQGAGAAAVNGHIRNIAYFNTRLPNAQLQTLTAPSLATTLSLDFTTGSYNVGF